MTSFELKTLLKQVLFLFGIMNGTNPQERQKDHIKDGHWTDDVME